MSEDGPTRKLPKEMFAAIGEVIVQWTHLTTLMDVAIYSMLGIKPTKGAWITAAVKYAGRKDILQSCAQNFFKDKPEVLAEFNRRMSEIDQCYGERNRIDHAVWWHFGPDTLPSMRVRVTVKAISPPEVQPVTPAEIHKTSLRIAREIQAFNDFLETHTPPPPT